MVSSFRYVALAVAAIPFIYYLIALFSSWQFFRSTAGRATDHTFTPPVSNLKPVRGLDPDAYENFASFCRQDYPDYELLFCVGDNDDPVVPITREAGARFSGTPHSCALWIGRKRNERQSRQAGPPGQRSAA